MRTEREEEQVPMPSPQDTDDLSDLLGEGEFSPSSPGEDTKEEPEVISPSQIDPDRTRDVRAGAGKLNRVMKARAEAEKKIARSDRELAKTLAEVVPQAMSIVSNNQAATAPASPVVHDPSRDKDVVPLLPPKDKIRIYQRLNDGKLNPINDYTSQEVKADGDITAFVNKRIRPNFGDMEYEIWLIDQLNHPRYFTTIPRKNPMQEPESNASAVRMLVETVRDSLAKQNDNKAPPIEIYDQMEKVMGLLQNQQKLDPTMVMMLPMIKDAMKSFSNNNDSTQLQAVLDVTTRLADRIDRLERTPPPPPMLPSFDQPQSDPLKMQLELIAKMSEVLRPAPPVVQPDTLSVLTERVLPLLVPFIPVITNYLDGKNKAEQQIAELKMEIQKAQLNPARSRTLLEQLQEFRELKSLARELNPVPQNQGPPVSESFWDFMSKAWEGMPQVLDSFRGMISEAKATPGQTAPVEQRQLEPASQPEPPKLQLEMTAEAKQALDVLAKADSKELIFGALFGFIQQAAKLKSWRKPLTVLVMRSKKGNNEGALEVFQGIIEALVNAGHLEHDVGQRVFSTLEDNLEEVMAKIKEFAP